MTARPRLQPPLPPLRMTTPTRAILGCLHIADQLDTPIWGRKVQIITGLAPGTVYPALNRLVQRGYVTATPDDGTRRILHRLTPQARRLPLQHCTRTLWGPGPWQNEPDTHDWTTPAGLPARARRAPQQGTWGTYIGLPPGHPLHGIDHDDMPHILGAVGHRTPTYSGPALPDGSEDDGTWWVGTDAMGPFDYAPGWVILRVITIVGINSANQRTVGLALSALNNPDTVYRTLSYLKGCTDLVADVLAAMA